MENYTHWFYLESYTFLFYSKNQYVIYNTLNSTYIDCSLYGKTINTVLSILHNTNKTYCVGIYEYQLRDSQFTEFIKKIRNTFSGDIIKNIRGIPLLSLSLFYGFFIILIIQRQKNTIYWEKMHYFISMK